MSATQAIDTDERSGTDVSLPLAASVALFAGILAARNSAGYLVQASDTAGLTGVGRVEFDVDNSTGAAGDQVATVRRGVFLFANSTGFPVVEGDLGKQIYIEDFQTVAHSNNNGAVAGIAVEISDAGVWVDTRTAAVSATVADASVTTAKLADAVADQIFATTVAIANTGSPDGVAHITGQVKDAQGNPLTGRFLVKLYTSATSYGAPSAQSGAAAAITNSRILSSDTANCALNVLTHSDGSWGVDVTTAAGNETIYAYASVAGSFAIANVAVTGN